MGLCISVDTSPEAKSEKRRSKELNQALADDHDKREQTNKLLLLGTGESGKSTLLKQMTILHGEGFAKELGLIKSHVIGNILDNMVHLCAHSKHHGEVRMVLNSNSVAVPMFGQWTTYGTIHKENQVHYDAILDVNQAPNGNSTEFEVPLTFDEELVNHIALLWADPGIQETYLKRSNFYLGDSTKYYLDKVRQIGKPDYEPTDQDALLSRVATTGIVEKAFNIDGNMFTMIDVGGQRNERKKWINCFDNVTAVLFVAAMSEYDQVLFEEQDRNRMRDAIQIFKELFLFPPLAENFNQSALIFFFNKKDLFATKVVTKPVSGLFPDEWAIYAQLYPEAAADTDIVSRESQFVEKLFLDQRLYDMHNPLYNTPEYQADLVELNRIIGLKDIYTHRTCATDTNHIKVVFDVVNDIVIKRGLQRAGLM